MNIQGGVHTVLHYSTVFFNIIIDRQGQCVYTNLLFQRALPSPEHFFSISLPASPRYKAIVELEAGSNQVIVQEIYHLAEDGEGRWVEWEFSALDKNNIQATGKDVTYEKQLLKQMPEQTLEMELFLNNSDETFLLVDRSFHVIAFNEAASRRCRDLLGKDLYKGISLWDVVLPGRRKMYEELYGAAFNGIFSEEEIELTAPNGEKKYFASYFKPAYNKDNEIVAVIVTARDVTTRKKTEQALKLSEERWKFALEGSNQGVWDWNITTGEVFYSPRWKALLGFGEEEVFNSLSDWQKRIHPDDISAVTVDISTHLHAENPYYENIYRLESKDGSWKWILARGIIVERDPDDKPLRMIGTHTDITALKQAEIALKASEENYRQLFYYNPQPMWIYDADTLCFLEVNEAAIKHYGYTLEEFRSMTIKDIRPQSDLQNLAERLNYIGQLPTPGFLESLWRHMKKDGTLIEVEIKSHNVEYHGRTARLVLANDITERREAAYKLAQERQLLRTLIDNLPDYIYIKDTALNPIITNQAMQELMNTDVNSSSDIAGNQLQSDKRVLESGDAVYNLEEAGTNNRGEQRWLLTTKVPLRDAEDKVIGLVGISRDITERRKLETALAEQRLNLQRSITEATIEAQEQERTDIGKELHDNINQILTTTKLYIDMAMNDEEVRLELLQKSHKNISRAIEEIRNLSKALVPPSLQDIGLKEAIHEMIVNLPVATGLAVKLKTSGLNNTTLPDPIKLMSYRIIQEQVNNIIKHAKASNAEIKLTVSEKLLNIIISDDGIGFDSKKKRRGIGLSNISSRAALHKGHIEILTAPGSGCTLKVFIPL